MARRADTGRDQFSHVFQRKLARDLPQLPLPGERWMIAPA
jgi:hypothetical protein